MSMLEIWLFFVVVPNLVAPLITINIICIISIIVNITRFISGDIDACGNKRYRDKYIPIFKNTSDKLLSALLISTTLLCLIPSKADVATMVIVPYISNNPEFKKLPDNISKYLNKLIAEQTKENDMSNYKFKIHTYKEDNNRYSYIAQYECNDDIHYLSSMSRFESPEEARIAATLLIEHNYLGVRDNV